MTTVLLSRKYVHMPWPIATCNVMSKPTGAGCNLGCEYCFYRHNADDSTKQKTESRNPIRAEKAEGLKDEKAKTDRQWAHLRQGGLAMLPMREEDFAGASCGSASRSPLTISDQLLETFIADYIRAVDNPTVFFTWQGGEPTLAGLEFYRKVIELQAKHKREGQIKGSKEVSSGFQER